MSFILHPWQLLLVILAGWVNREQQDVIEYLSTENQVLKEKLGKKRILLNDDQRRRLAVKGKVLGRKMLEEVGTLFTPDTILRWHRMLAARKWDYSDRRQRKPGRPETPEAVVQLVVQIARENTHWGYDRIQGTLTNLGHQIADQTIGNILKDHGIEPAPDRIQPWLRFGPCELIAWRDRIVDNLLDKLPRMPQLLGDCPLRHPVHKMLSTYQFVMFHRMHSPGPPLRFGIVAPNEKIGHNRGGPRFHAHSTSAPVPVLMHVATPKRRPRDRIFWVVLSRLWPNWRSALAIVQPETVIKWHGQGFKLYWRRKSRPGKPGRPPIEREIRDLIRRMSRENPTWGAPRIVSELALLGHDVAEETVAKYMVRTRIPLGRVSWEGQ